MPVDKLLYIKKLHIEIGDLVYLAVRDGYASMRAIAAIIDTRDNTFESVYRYYSNGRKSVDGLLPMKRRAPDGKERELVEINIPIDVKDEMERMGVSIRKWAHFYGRDIKYMIENWANGTKGNEIFGLFKEDFPDFCMMQKFEDYSMPKIHPLFYPIDCVTSKGKPCFPVRSQNYAEIKRYGEKKEVQEKKAKFWHYLIIKRERLKVFLSKNGSLSERIKAVQEWKPEIIEKHKFEFRYELPDWIKFIDDKNFRNTQMVGLEVQILMAPDYNHKIILEKELEVKKREIEMFTRKINKPSFLHAEVQDFWNRYVESPKLTDINRDTIHEILDLLDKDGDCSSVVNKNPKEAEREYPRNSYDALAKVTLLEHSLLVAELMAAEEDRYGILKHKNIIVGLGHDLGKLTGIYKFHYKSSAHPILSKELLNKMRFFPDHPSRVTILTAIVGHHPRYDQSKIKDIWVKQLVKCDSKARDIERNRVGGYDRMSE